MKQSYKWHYLVIMTVPLGVFLSMRFGFLGLVLFSILNLAICFRCLDTNLPEKKWPRDYQLKGKKLNTPSSTNAQVVAWALLISPIVLSIGFTWFFPPQEIARFILEWDWLGVINQNNKIAAAYMVDTSVIDLNISDSNLRGLEEMRGRYPRVSMFAIISRIMVYLFLPIFIALTTFSRAQELRAKPISTQSGHNELFKAFKNFEIGGLAMLLFIIFSYLCSAPYFMLDLNSFYIPLTHIIMPFLLPVIWVLGLSKFDNIIVRLHTYFTHAYP